MGTQVFGQAMLYSTGICSSSFIAETWLRECFWALKPDGNIPDVPSLIMLMSRLSHESISFMQRKYIFLITACRKKT